MNSASLSTNFLISHGQATRSTLTYSRDTSLGEPDCSVGIGHTLAIERRGGRGGGGPPMPVRPVDRGQRPWNKGLLIGQKKPLEPKHVWSIRVRLEIARSRRDLAIFNLAIDSKLRACDLVKLRLDDVCSGANVRHRATIVQKKTGRPVQFEITVSRDNLDENGASIWVRRGSRAEG